MNQAFVSISPLHILADRLQELTPEMKKAAHFIIKNPQEVGISTVREIAKSADVNPNTFIRMARQLGFDGYEAFRQPFREAIRQGSFSFSDRARWLQDRRKQGHMGPLYADMISATLRNIEETFAAISDKDLREAAEAIWNARTIFTLGVGVNYANAQNFTYLASTGMVQFHTIPKAGTAASDDLAWADSKDLLIALTHTPCRQEVIDTIKLARTQGMKIIGISDSPVNPPILEADYGFVTAIDTPQFFPSSVAIIALLETLLSFVIASASDTIVKRVEAFHQRRHDLGLYVKGVA